MAQQLQLFQLRQRLEKVTREGKEAAFICETSHGNSVLCLTFYTMRNPVRNIRTTIESLTDSQQQSNRTAQT